MFQNLQGYNLTDLANFTKKILQILKVLDERISNLKAFLL